MSFGKTLPNIHNNWVDPFSYCNTHLLSLLLGPLVCCWSFFCSSSSQQKSPNSNWISLYIFCGLLISEAQFRTQKLFTARSHTHTKEIINWISLMNIYNISFDINRINQQQTKAHGNQMVVLSCRLGLGYWFSGI